LYRLNSGVSYPYTAAGICSITGCDIGSTYFYSWFNWTVQGEGCSSPRTLATATVIPQAIASFSNIVNGNSVDFSNTSLNAIAYSWDFGDGQTSTQTDPTHIFSTPDTYTVTLIAIGSGSCPNDTITQQVDVTNAPNADFSAIQLCVGGTTIFTDESSIASGSIASWDWDFGDGTTHSTLQNPSHTYTDSGYYNVTLIVVSNIGFADTNTQQIYIEPRPTAAFSFTAGATGQMTYFTDETNGHGSTLIAWLWNFGDGSTSVQQNPDHVYNAEGTYWATLVVFNDCGSDTVVQQIVIVTDGIHETENTLQLFPNPVQDNMTTLIFTSQAAETFSIRLYSSDGQIISTSTFDAVAGENRYQLRLDELSKGMYWLELSSEQRLQRIPLIK
jgi:PKD repeat protein